MGEWRRIRMAAVEVKAGQNKYGDKSRRFCLHRGILPQKDVGASRISLLLSLKVAFT